MDNVTTVPRNLAGQGKQLNILFDTSRVSWSSWTQSANTVNILMSQKWNTVNSHLVVQKGRDRHQIHSKLRI